MSLALADLIQVEQIGDEAELEALRDDWNQLAGNVPFRRFEWLTTWWRHYRQPDWKLFVITVREADGELIGLAPWYWSRSRRSGRVLRFLGSGEVCSDHLTLLAADKAEAAVASHVADWLTDEARRQWDSLELVGLDAGDATIDLLADHLEVHGYDIHRQRGVNCWRVEFPDTWEDYVASLSKSRRERVHKLLRRNFDTGLVTTGTVEHADELEHYFRRLVELHQKRRASLGQHGCFASPRFTAFHRDVMAQLLSLGLLRLWWTNLDGRPAAIEYDLIGGDTIYFYQSGIEPELARRSARLAGQHRVAARRAATRLSQF